MIRFILAPEAILDLDEILAYLDGLPVGPANRLGKELQRMLKAVASHPLQGHRHQEFSIRYGSEIRTRVAVGYVLYYVAVDQPRLVLGIIHGKRDADSIMRERLA